VRAAALAACALLAAACAAPAATTGGAAAAPAPPADDGRAATTELARAEDQAVGWLAAADPRLTTRTGATAPPEVLARLGTDAVLAEDPGAAVHGVSLDLFAFRARTHALEEAARALAAVHGQLPETAPVGAEIARPRLERELLGRLVEEERARAEDEAKLGDASGDLVRGMVATWTQPERPQDVADRDTWAAKHLLEMRESLKGDAPRTGPPDLDVALYPLERLLAPMQYPRGSAAIAQLRMALDADLRATPKVDVAARLVRSVQVHLGVTVDPAALPERLGRVEARLREAVQGQLQALDAGARAAVLARARALVMVESSCAPVADSRVRSFAPPPERAAVCGVLRAFDDEAGRLPALVALHDDVLLAFAAVTPSPPSRTRLLSHPDDDDVDAMERAARERPAHALGPALAAEILVGAENRAAAWRALGDAPLDVVARELGDR
jgi:hypothetical protein